MRDSPVSGKHLRDQGQGQVIARSDVGVTTYGCHGHSARHCACCIAQSAFIVLILKYPIAETKVWRTGDIGIAAALGGIDIGDRFSTLALMSQNLKQLLLTEISPAHIFL